MKPISELRKSWDLYPSQIGCRLKSFSKMNMDFNVYLPTKGKNLQRSLCWTLQQKREIVMSIILERHIPALSIINVIDRTDNSKEINQVIDGKQRLSSMIGFLNGEFSIVLEGNEYFFNDLPNDYQSDISNYVVRYNVVNERWDSPMTDQQKIDWFKFINFAGTQQDAEHLEGL